MLNFFRVILERIIFGPHVDSEYLYPMKGKNKRKWKSLTLKVEHLRLELEDRKEYLDEISAMFMEELSGVSCESAPDEGQADEVNKKVVHHDAGDNEPTNVDEIETSPDPEIPDEIKSLWKQIAVAAHPDKTSDDHEKTELYKRAAAAMSSGQVDEIVAVAMALGIDIPEASPVAVNRLEKVADDLQVELKNIENSVLWQWGNAPKNKRDAIMALYMKSKGLRPKKKDS
jgi:hypothetical protein